VVPTDACQNAADLAIIQADADAISAKAKECGMGCIADPDIVTCATPCVEEGTGLTAACSSCYVGIIGCTIQNCIAECFADAEAPACKTCQEEKGCTEAFYACSGLPQN